MAARAIWKGTLVLDSEDNPLTVGLKVYSAIEDRAVHFHVLHAADNVSVEQRIVRKDNEVPREDQRKAFPLDGERAVILSSEELDSLDPQASRDIELLRFVPISTLGDQWYDRPYYLGPDDVKDEGAYFALAKVLADKGVVGIARWTMRKKRYLGALGASRGYLTMTTLRRAEQVLALPDVTPDKARTPSESELRLADQLVETISADFEPEAWENEYRKRLREVIDAKTRGER